MNETKTNRWLLLSGLLFAVLWLYVSLPKGELGFLERPEAVAAFYAGSSDLFGVHGYLGALSGLFLLIFVGTVRSLLLEAGPKTGAATDLAFAGGIVAAALTIGGWALQLFLSGRAGSAAGVAPDAAVAISDIIGALTSVAMPIALAVFVGAAGLALARSRLLPTWFGWASVVVAVGLASPIMYYLMLGGLLWAVVASLWLFARGGRASETAIEAASQQPA